MHGWEHNSKEGKARSDDITDVKAKLGPFKALMMIVRVPRVEFMPFFGLRLTKSHGERLEEVEWTT